MRIPPLADPTAQSLPEDVGGADVDWSDVTVLTGRGKPGGTAQISALAVVLQSYGVLSGLPLEDRAQIIKDDYGHSRNGQMIRLPDEDDRAIVDDVLPAEIVDLAVPVALDRLLPWHRPRKQLVRENQWINLSRRLIEKERNKPGLRAPGTSLREVRYLTLPGIDYLDVRQLADVCRELDCSLTSTGFQSMVVNV